MAKLTDIMLLQQPAQPALVIEKRGTINNFSLLISEGFQRIGSYMEELGELPTDIPSVEYPAYEEMTDENIGLIITFYTLRPLPEKGDIRSVTIPARKAIACLHQGSYDALAQLYREMAEWIRRKGYEPTGTSIEHYYTGPEIPEAEQITRIVMPLK